ncbi:hypothetical protein HK102_000918 [Quaeritorhiza haematococci]|nr:hypothetical protein HK102_000918 [Quaeritorhiza haematococci]
MKSGLHQLGAIITFSVATPQSSSAICNRYGLAIGAHLACPPLTVRLDITASSNATSLPVTSHHEKDEKIKKKSLKWKPGGGGSTARDRSVSSDERVTSPKAEDSHFDGDVLTVDEVNIIKAVLDISEKTASQICTPIEDVFALSVDQVLDRKTIDEIKRRGHSRIPVYKGTDRRDLIAMLLVKRLVGYDPDVATTMSVRTRSTSPNFQAMSQRGRGVSPSRGAVKKLRKVSEIKLSYLPMVDENTGLFEILHQFQEGRSHMAAVTGIRNQVPDNGKGKERQTDVEVLGIITLEDVIEELIGEEIIDEFDQYVDIHKKTPVDRERDEQTTIPFQVSESNRHDCDPAADTTESYENTPSTSLEQAMDAKPNPSGMATTDRGADVISKEIEGATGHSPRVDCSLSSFSNTVPRYEDPGVAQDSATIIVDAAASSIASSSSSTSSTHHHPLPTVTKKRKTPRSPATHHHPKKSAARHPHSHLHYIRSILLNPQRRAFVRAYRRAMMLSRSKAAKGSDTGVNVEGVGMEETGQRLQDDNVEMRVEGNGAGGSGTTSEEEDGEKAG